VQGTTRSVLGSVDANDGYVLEFDVTVPQSAVPGRASLEVGIAQIPIWIDAANVSVDAPAPSTSAVRQYRSRGPGDGGSGPPTVVVAMGALLAGGAAVIAFQDVRRRRNDRRC